MWNALMWRLIAPLMPAITILCVSYLLRRYTTLTPRRRMLFEECDAKEALLEDQEEEDEELPQLTASASRASAADSAATDKYSKSFATAVSTLCLLGYAGMTQGTMRLLRCVSVDNQSVLYFAGETLCSASWQWIIFLLCAVLIVVPLAPVVIWLFSSMPYHNNAREWARGQRMPNQLLLRAIRDYAMKLYAPRYWHWAAVLGLHRLTMIICR